MGLNDVIANVQSECCDSEVHDGYYNESHRRGECVSCGECNGYYPVEERGERLFDRMHDAGMSLHDFL